jgi:glycerol-3-phosphate dehydrogenase (NAD(P)+)
VRRVAILGAGSWGTALAQTFCNQGLEVRLWARTASRAAEMEILRRNVRYLPDLELDPSIAITNDLSRVCGGAELVIVAVPTHGLAAIAALAAPHLEPAAAVVSAAKGFDLDGLRTMTAVLLKVLGDAWRPRLLAMSGPNIAVEVALGLPAATVVAGFDSDWAETVRDTCSGSQLRVYSSPDVLGVEYGGALKNVVAIAAGICDGIGIGDNGKAAIITRGLAEMARLGVAAGARPLTFAGLTGLGDCILTCMSPHSRNRLLGVAMARGRGLDEVVASTPMIAEGVNATRAAMLLAERHGVDMPIAREVHAVLFEGKPIAAALADLMSRGPADELRGLGLSGL